MPTVNILFFGRLADRLGHERSIEVDGPCSVADLRRRVAAAFEDAGELLQPHIRAAVGKALVGEDAMVAPGAEVAFLPPFSGG